MASVKSLNVVSNALVLLEALARHQPAGGERARPDHGHRQERRPAHLGHAVRGWLDPASRRGGDELGTQRPADPDLRRIPSRSALISEPTRCCAACATRRGDGHAGRFRARRAAHHCGRGKHACGCGSPRRYLSRCHSRVVRPVARWPPACHAPRLSACSVKQRREAELRVLDGVRERGWSEIDEELFPHTHSMGCGVAPYRRHADRRCHDRRTGVSAPHVRP